MNSKTIKQYPILSGTVRLDPGSQDMRMVAHLPDKNSTAESTMNRIFRVVKHDQEGMVTYEILRSVEFAPERLDIGTLAPFETNTDPAVASAVFAAQVNIIPGGILIAFQLHHTIADGKALSQVAAYMTALPASKDEYFGAATLMVRAQQTIIDLVAAHDALCAQQEALPLAKIALSIRQAVAGVDTEFVRRRIRLALSVEAHNLTARGTGEKKLQTRHVFKPEEHVDVVISTLGPIFKMESAALKMLQPDFLRPLHHAMIDGVVDVVPAVKRDRVEMTLALEEEVMQRLLEMASLMGFVKP